MDNTPVLNAWIHMRPKQRGRVPQYVKEENMTREAFDRQAELGALCIKYSLSKQDIFMLQRIKDRRKMNECNYVIDNNIDIADLEKINDIKHWVL